MGTHGMAEGDFVRGFLRVTARDGRRLADHDYTQGAATKGAHYGADALMCRDIAAFLRGESAGLPSASWMRWRRGSRRWRWIRPGPRAASST